MAQKTILVTGGAGFVGSHLCERLAKEGHAVISLDNYFAGSKENHVPGVEYREGHTKDIARLVTETPDIIYHLGEYSRVEQSVLEPEVVHDLNVLGTAAVVEYWHEKKCKLVYAGSSTKFGDGGATRHTSPYAASKAANSELVRDTGERDGLPYAVTYFYNVYGPRERSGVYGTMVENFKQMYLRGTPLCVVSPGTQSRNFTHVDDIIDGLVLIGEKGNGEYGLGNEQACSVLEVARLFGGPIVMLPERQGNRMTSGIDTSRANALGWRAKRQLRDYVAAFVGEHPRGAALERRVLVFSTTFFPVEGPAEAALRELIARMPDVQFDIVTAALTSAAKRAMSPSSNAHIHRIGFGSRLDKYLLPFWGHRVASRLHAEHSYLFAWSVLASYGSFAALLLRHLSGVPLLITLADQDLSALSASRGMFLKRILSGADQVYAMTSAQETRALAARGAVSRRSLGDGDAFANNIRFAYEQILRSR